MSVVRCHQKVWFCQFAIPSQRFSTRELRRSWYEKYENGTLWYKRDQKSQDILDSDLYISLVFIIRFFEALWKNVTSGNVGSVSPTIYPMKRLIFNALSSYLRRTSLISATKLAVVKIFLIQSSLWSCTHFPIFVVHITHRHVLLKLHVQNVSLLRAVPTIYSSRCICAMLIRTMLLFLTVRVIDGWFPGFPKIFC